MGQLLTFASAPDLAITMFRRYYVQVLHDKLAALHLPLALIATFEPTLPEIARLREVYVQDGEDAWLHALRELLEAKWDRAPAVYWWPWSEQWTTP